MPKRAGTYKRRGYKKTNLGRAVRQIVTNMDEHKYFSHFPQLNNTAASATWTSYSLLCGYNLAGSNVGIRLGTGANQRTGNKIKLQGIDLMIRIDPVVTATMNTGTQCRFVVFHDKQANGTTFGAGNAFAESSIISSMYNPVYENRVVPHNDFSHVMGTTGSDSAGTQTSVGPEGLYKIHIPARSVVNYSADTDLVDSITDNNWFIAVMASGATCCNITMQCVVRYLDA